MFAFGVSEVVQASVVTAIGGILIALITQFTRSNAKDHAIVQHKLDQLSDTHTSVTEVKVDVKYLREDQNRLENRFNTHLEDRNEKPNR